MRMQNFQEAFIYTVKPVYKYHPWESAKVVFMDRWSLCTSSNNINKEQLGCITIELSRNGVYSAVNSVAMVNKLNIVY